MKMHWAISLALLATPLALLADSAAPMQAGVETSVVQKEHGTYPASQPNYHLLQTIALPGDKGWDYLKLDSEARRLYVTHGDEVLLLDVDSKHLLGSVHPLQGIHGVALAADMNRGYVSDGKANAVTCFDLKTLSITAEILAGQKPDAILYEPLTSRVFAFNGGSDSVTIIQTGDNAVLKNLDLGGGPEFCVTDGQGHVFVNLEDKSQLLRIDAKSMKVTGRWEIAPGKEPSSLSMDIAHHRLFIGCRNQMAVVMDSDLGKVVASFPIGAHVDASGFDPGLGLIFHSCGDGSLSVVHEDSPDHYSSFETVATKKGARTMALDLKTHQVYLASADFGAAPIPSAANPHPRHVIVPGSFKLLVFGRP